MTDRSDVRAVCPLCDRTVTGFRWHGRMIFVQHTSDGLGGRAGGVFCQGSGWLIEDEEMVA